MRRRFEREALALQRVLPQVHIRQRDVIRYIASSIWVDVKQAGAEGMLAKTLSDIVRYRVNQYIGSYVGNRVHQELSHFEKERYFYPDLRKFRSGGEDVSGAKASVAEPRISSDP